MLTTTTRSPAGMRLTRGLAVAIAFCSLAGTSAQAGLPDPFELHDRLRDQVVHDLRTLAAVPRVILADHRAALDPYAVRGDWDRDHRHYYSSYRFPVLVDGVRTYRAFDYCDDRIVLGASIGLPRLAVNIAVPGIFIDGVAYAPLAPPAYRPARGYGYARGHRGGGCLRGREEYRGGWRERRGDWRERGRRGHDRDDED